MLSTARDIIFLWVARMVMMGSSSWAPSPFSDVYVHSVIQAPDGRRMSKSLGTGIDPLEEIDEHGADALRFGLLMMSTTQDVRFSDDDRAGPAAREQALERGPPGARPRRPRRRAGPAPETLADRWIASRVRRPWSRRARSREGFELSQLADLVYHLIFGELCDWYLELVKAGEASPEMAGPRPRADPRAAHP